MKTGKKYNFADLQYNVYTMKPCLKNQLKIRANVLFIPLFFGPKWRLYV